ncbi:nucleotide-binding protein [Pengzhenrongella sp.]|uniref:nucleotide-binding protein n=1 Tax=Pengzhenrongella sp. TaxID=2888820 RepID=UPI002F92BF2F
MVGPPRVFIGSSTEGKSVAENFQAALGADAEVTVWDQGIFGAGGYTMESLEAAALASDFAVLVMTPDDTLTMRGEERPAPRGNVLIELGLFMGALGVRRVLMLSPQSAAIAFPSDLSGITRLSYDAARGDGNLRAALNPAALAAKAMFKKRGLRQRGREPGAAPSTAADHARLLAGELDLLWVAAEAQGWRRIRPNSQTTIRLLSPKEERFSHTLSTDAATERAKLRVFTHRLRANGLRVNDRIRRPI